MKKNGASVDPLQRASPERKKQLISEERLQRTARRQGPTRNASIDDEEDAANALLREQKTPTESTWRNTTPTGWKRLRESINSKASRRATAIPTCTALHQSPVNGDC